MIAEKKFKRGDTREDGMVFWCYRHGKEAWVTRDELIVCTARQREHDRKRRGTTEYRARKRDYVRSRRQRDPLAAAAHRLRVRTRTAFDRISALKPASTETLLGTDWETVKIHIESQFVNDMSWENMNEWHIDHIVPLASAKTEEELAKLCHYTNLQPLFAFDNRSKGAKLPPQLTHE